MARLPLIDPETTGGDMRKSFDRMPVVLNIFRMMARLTEATDVDLDPAAGMTVFEGGQRRTG